MPLQPQRINIPLGGGLSQDETPEYLDPPALFTCENFYHKTRTSLVKRNGYDRNIVVADSRGFPRDMSIPFNNSNAPIDRFLETDESVTFAARGCLWSYVPQFYIAASSTGQQQPNTIRHGEIPDLQINRQAFVSLEPALSSHQVVDTASCSASGIVCNAWVEIEGSNYLWKAQIVDASSGVTFTTLLLSTTDTLLRPAVASFNTGIVAFVIDTVTQTILVQRYLFNTAAWTSLTFPAVVYSTSLGSVTLSGYRFYDACGTNTDSITMGVAPATTVIPLIDPLTVVNALFVFTYKPSTNTITHGPHYISDHTVGGGGCVGLFPLFAVAGKSGDHGACVWCNVTTNQVHFRTFDGDTLNTDTVVGAPDATNQPCHKVAIGPILPTNGFTGQWALLYEHAHLDWVHPTNNRYSVQSKVLDSFPNIIAVSTYWSTNIVSDPFCINGQVYAVLAPNVITSAISVSANVSDTPLIVTRICGEQDRGDDPPYRMNPLGVWAYGENYSTPMAFRFQIDVNGNSMMGIGSIVTADPFTLYGVSGTLLGFDPTSPDRYDSAPLPNGGCIFGCAQPWTFDGVNAFESAFVTRPVLLNISEGVGGSLPQDTGDNAHFFKLVYEQIDERGRVTTSGPSGPYKYQITAPSRLLTLEISNLYWTARKPGSTYVRVYMCTDNESYALAGSAECTPTPHLGIPGSVPGNLEIVITHDTTISDPALYTNDGTLAADYPQLASHLIRWNNRIWIADAHNVTYTQPFEDGVNPSFPASFVEYLDRSVTALTPLDDRILLFSSDAVMYRSGEGPNLNGQSSSYSNWAFLTHEIGCINSRSVFHAMVGVFFQSRRGIELMDGNGNFVHQRAIEGLFLSTSNQGQGDTVVGTLSLPRDHQARFLVRQRSDNKLYQLVFEYSTGSWSRWSSSNTPWHGDPFIYCGDITINGDTVYLADSFGFVYVEANGRQYDVDFPLSAPPVHYHIDWTIKTPWIKADGLQGVQRVWRSNILARCQPWTSPPYGGAPIPNLGMGVTENTDYDIGGLSITHTNGTIDTLQSRRDSSGRFYFDVHHVKQQCRAFQLILISLDGNSWSYTQDVSGVYELLGIWVEFGIEPGTGRHRAESKI